MNYLQYFGMCGKSASRPTKSRTHGDSAADDRVFDPYGAERTVGDHGSSVRQLGAGACFRRAGWGYTAAGRGPLSAASTTYSNGCSCRLCTVGHGQLLLTRHTLRLAKLEMVSWPFFRGQRLRG